MAGGINMSQKVILTRTFASSSTQELDLKVNKFLINMQSFSFYDFKLHNIVAEYTDGKFIKTIVYEVKSLYANDSLR